MEKELLEKLGLEGKPKIWHGDGFIRNLPFYEFDKDIYVVDDEFFTRKDIGAIIFIDTQNRYFAVSKEYAKSFKSLYEFKKLILNRLSKSTQTLITLPDLSL